MNLLKSILTICCLFSTVQFLLAQNLQLHISGDTITGGVLIDNVRGDGITVRDTINATTDGFQALNVGDDGVYVSSAGDDSFQSSRPAGDGFFSVSSGDDGFAAADSQGDGIYITNSVGRAGFFGGNVEITGTLTKAAGTFKIDHPLDPENKTLSHSFVESPDMMNIYNGNIVLNEKGTAIVQLPNWFNALNKDFRYQLTCIGGFAQVYISKKINNNQFEIAGGQPGLEVSWQITGVRNDAYAQKFRTPVEEKKSEVQKGYYLQPKAYNKTYEKSIDHLKRTAKIERAKNLIGNKNLQQKK